MVIIVWLKVNTLEIKKKIEGPSQKKKKKNIYYNKDLKGNYKTEKYSVQNKDFTVVGSIVEWTWHRK